MVGPNPPHNYRVVVENGVRKLYFDTAPNVVKSSIFIMKQNGQQHLGITETNSINVPDDVFGMEGTKGQSEDLSGWWGVANNPAIPVDYGSPTE